MQILRSMIGVMLLFPIVAQAEGVLSFRVTHSFSDRKEPITGRLLVYLNSQGADQPMTALDWFHPEPFCAIEVTDLRPGESVILNDQADAFPDSISKWPVKKYRAQAVLDHDFYFAEPANGPGNLYSEVVPVDLVEGGTGEVTLELTHVVPSPAYHDNHHTQFLQIRSPRLSGHHHRDVIDRAAVILPRSYHTQPERRYPVFYQVSGFGDSLAGAARRAQQEHQSPTASGEEIEFIVVVLTGECKWGHHVYANSATNGPRGDALIHEMIPHIDQNFRTIADPRARFVGGHSSGGWSSLWLQVRYPESFGGVWSSSPDPVDFRNWQGTDLYASPPQSVFIDPQGQRRPIARHGREIALYYDSFNRMDDVLGRGGQLRSFDAVFSPRDARGQPAACWNRTTGIINPQVAEHWKRYDIGIYVEENWKTLKPLLAGKIHIVMGDLDTFYLNGATRQLDERLKRLGSDARVEFLPTANHFDAYGEMATRRHREMRDAFSRVFQVDGTPR